MKLILQIAAGVLLALGVLVLGAAIIEQYEVYKLEQKLVAIKEETSLLCSALMSPNRTKQYCL